MDNMQMIFKVVADGLRSLAKEIDKMGKSFGKLEPGASVSARGKRATTAKPSKKSAVKKPRKETATDAVLSVISGSIKGADTETIKKKTGFENKKIYNIINQLKKQGRVKNLERGVYGKFDS